MMRAKLRVSDVDHISDTQENLTFNAVTGTDPFGPNGESEDNTYSRWTPPASTHRRAEPMVGDIFAVEIRRPGRAALIAKNGWLCAHPGCGRTPTVEVRFIRAANGPIGYSVGSHGTCDEHAEDHARSLKADYDAIARPSGVER